MKSLLSFFKKTRHTCQKFEEIEGIEFKFRKNSLSKSLRISLKDNKSVLVTLPRRASFSLARDFAIKNLDDIKRALKNIEPCDTEKIEALRKEAKIYLPKRLDELAKLYGYKYQKVTIKRLKTRWGSCSYKNNINLNLSLMLLDKDLIDYVLLHELVHTVEKNHGINFWARLLMHMPDAKFRRYALKSRKVI